jgi:hypothetical protein
VGKCPDSYRLAEMLGRLRTIGQDDVRGLDPVQLDAEASAITTHLGEWWAKMLALAARAEAAEGLLRRLKSELERQHGPHDHMPGCDLCALHDEIARLLEGRP